RQASALAWDGTPAAEEHSRGLGCLQGRNASKAVAICFGCCQRAYPMPCCPRHRQCQPVFREPVRVALKLPIKGRARQTARRLHFAIFLVQLRTVSVNCPFGLARPVSAAVFGPVGGAVFRQLVRQKGALWFRTRYKSLQFCNI